jgi:uncharacterized protein (TIGR02996 family)
MAAEDGFLQDILAHPDDMAPRLIYADWLTEHGDAERGEFIRVQIDLDREEREDRYSPRWRELTAREENLLRAYKRKWAAPLLGQTLYLRFYRGFVEEATVTASSFCRRGHRLFRLTPLRRIKVSLPVGARVRMAEVARSPNLARLRSVDLSLLSGLAEDGVCSLAASPLAAGLEELRAERASLSGPALEALGGSPHLAGLRALQFSLSGTDLVGLRALACSPHLTRLTELDVSTMLIVNSPQSDAVLDVFREAPAWEGLTALNLSGHGLSDAGLTALAGPTCLGRLTALRLDWNIALGDAAVETVARSPRLANLQILSMRNCHAVGDGALQALAASPYPRLWKQLDFGGDPMGLRQAGRITDAGVRALAASQNMARLRSLELAAHRVTDEGAEAIVASPHLAQLGRLNLKNNPVSKDMQKALRKRYGPGVCTFSLG